MNKIVIVGHPLSGYEEVETLLNACGMATAQPSRREGYMPGQISTTLCKVHSTSPLSQLETDDQIQQIEAGPVWHGMALDLMLGNLEQPFWGWADPQSIYLLNYWRDLDPSITFILVYDRPHSVLTQASAEEAASLSPETLSQRTRNWAAYNAALLHFFHRNPQRCLLVHSQQVRESASSYLQQVRARIDAPWSERMEQLSAPEALEAPAAHETPGAAAENSSDNATAPTSGAITTGHSPATATAAQALETLAPAHTAEPSPHRAPAHNALALFVADALLRQHPTSLQLYEELQAVANLPFAEGADRIVTPDTALHAWLAMSAHQQRLQEQTRLADTQLGQINELNQRLSHTEALAQQKQQLVERLSQAQAQAEHLAQERQRVIDEQTRLHHNQSEASQRRLAELQSERQALQQAQQTGQQENELLLAQLHQVQEALERQHLEAQQQAQQTAQEQARLAAAQAQASQRAAELSQQAEQLKQQLAEKEQQAQSHAAQARMSQAEKQASEQEHELLLTQLHQVQEELERHYLANQEQSQKVQALLHTDKLAAERQQHIEQLRQQLAAQTQQATAKTTQLSQQAEQLKQQLAEKEQQAQSHAAQARMSQAEKQASQQENELLLTQLHQMQEELERHYLANQEQTQKVLALLHTDKLAAERQQQIEQLSQQLANQTQQATEKINQLRQQADQLKQQFAENEREAAAEAAQLQAQLLEVRAQAAAPVVEPVLEQENDLLLAQLEQVREELELYHQENLRIKRAPILQVAAPLTNAPVRENRITKPVYYGAGERVRQQLSYRIGTTLIRQSTSILGWFGMPMALIRETRHYQSEKPQRLALNLPPISHYRDAHEAERYRKHLSFRLGQTFLTNLRSPIGWMRMPFALRREVKLFRNETRGH